MGVCQMCLVKPWQNCTAQNVWTFTLRNLHGIITQMERTSVQAFPTCCLWFTLNTDRKNPLISFFQGYMVLKFTHWLTRFNSRALRILKFQCVLLVTITEGNESWLYVYSAIEFISCNL